MRKLATMLRVADALDRSHHQPITDVRPRRSNGEISLRIKARAPVDLELWDVAHEAPLFRQVFGAVAAAGKSPGAHDVEGGPAAPWPRRWLARAGCWLRGLRRREPPDVPGGLAGAASCWPATPTCWRAIPQAVAEKLARMAGNRFDYFRGSAEPAAADARRASPTPAASQVAVLGDPHPENIGTYPLPDGDAWRWTSTTSTWPATGRYAADLRRLALGLWVAGDMAGLGKKQRVRLVEALAEGYLRGDPGAGAGAAAVRAAGRTRRSTAGWRRSWPAPDTLDEGGRGRR